MNEELYTEEFISSLPEFQEGRANPWVVVLCKSRIPAMEDLRERMERAWPRVPDGMRNNLRNWLRSPNDSKFLGFLLEFFLAGEFRRRGWEFEYEPLCSKGPDFVIKRGTGSFYLEAYVPDDPEYYGMRREWWDSLARDGVAIETGNWKGVYRPCRNVPRGVEDQTGGPRVLGELRLCPGGEPLELTTSEPGPSAGQEHCSEAGTNIGGKIRRSGREQRAQRLRDRILDKAEEGRGLRQPYVVAVCHGGSRLEDFFGDAEWMLFEDGEWKADHVSALILWWMVLREREVLFQFEMHRNPSAVWPAPDWVFPEGGDHAGVPFWSGGFEKDGAVENNGRGRSQSCTKEERK